MLSTCCTFTKSVFVLLIVAATCQLAITAPTVRRCTSLSDAERDLRDGLLVASLINEAVNATQLAIGKACNLLDHYNLLKEDGRFNNSNILHIFLEQNVLDACTVWVKSGNSKCVIDNLTELKLECQNIRSRLPTMIAEAYNETTGELLGRCSGPALNICGWLKRTLTLEQCSRSGLTARIPNCSCS